MKIAITGNIGSGKSTFSNFAKEHGFPVLIADDISKEILENDAKVRESVIKNFGKESYLNNKPNKIFLAEKIFSNEKNRIKLETILHPRVIKKVNQSISDLEKKHKVVFIEAALIYEADMEKLFDYVVLITSDIKLRMKRKLKSGLTEIDFNNREANQIPEGEKEKRADFTFTNNGSIKELKSKFTLLLLTIGIK